MMSVRCADIDAQRFHKDRVFGLLPHADDDHINAPERGEPRARTEAHRVARRDAATADEFAVVQLCDRCLRFKFSGKGAFRRD